WQSAFGSIFVTLYDGKTGALLNNLSKDERGLNQYAKFLADGRVAMIMSGQKKVTIKVFNHDGVEEHNIDLGDGSGLGIGAEVAPGKLLVTLNKEEYSLIRDSGETFIVDVNDGTITK